MKSFQAAAVLLLVPALVLGKPTPNEADGVEWTVIEEAPGFPIESNEYGTAETYLVNLNPSDFVVISGDVTRIHSAIVYPATDGGSIDIAAPIHLPSGVVVESVTTHYYDDHTGANPIFGWFTRTQVDDTITFVHPTPFPDGAPGWTTAEVFPNVTIDNEGFHYGYRIQLSRASSSEIHRLKRVSIRVRRQVAPAPESARFTDVPVGHPLHQYVEALAASGITAGCTQTEFCPGAAITRGQLAVFLAKALGLHWAP